MAAGLAQSMSTVTTKGTAATSGTQNGYSTDISSIRDGNDFTVDYRAERRSADGQGRAGRRHHASCRSTISMRTAFASSALIFRAAQLGGFRPCGRRSAPGFTVSGSGSTVTVLDDGSAGTTDVTGMTRHTTATALQNGDLGLSVFVDNGNADFTDNLDGKGQKLRLCVAHQRQQFALSRQQVPGAVPVRRLDGR